ncbi:MAG TPA: hypothetical protein VNK41_02780 [Vicinamibacterales bacterium]|nr:hypothetical protein [Vicinamibacterales bacterium]
MKKALLGCLGVSVLLLVAAGVLSYIYVYKPAKSFVAGIAQFEEVTKLNAQVQNQSPFSPPAGGELTQDLVDRYMKVQRSLRERMGPTVQELEAKYKAFEGPDARDASISEMLGAIRDLAGLIVEAKRAQVAALNAQGFSLAEYEWVRGSMYAALGVPLQSTFQDALRQAQGEAPAMPMEPMTTTVPEINKQLVAPYAKELQDGAALAFFGL